VDACACPPPPNLRLPARARQVWRPSAAAIDRRGGTLSHACTPPAAVAACWLTHLSVMAKQVQQRFGGQRLVVGKLQTQLRHHAKGVGLDEQRGTEALLAEDLAAGELAGADDLQRTGGQLLLGAGGGGRPGRRRRQGAAARIRAAPWPQSSSLVCRAAGCQATCRRTLQTSSDSAASPSSTAASVLKSSCSAAPTTERGGAAGQHRLRAPVPPPGTRHDHVTCDHPTWVTDLRRGRAGDGLPF